MSCNPRIEAEVARRSAASSASRAPAAPLPTIDGSRFPQEGPRTSVSTAETSSLISEKNRRQLSSTERGSSRKREYSSAMKPALAPVRNVVPSISAITQTSTSPPRKRGSMGIGTCLGLDPRFRGGDELWEVRATFICAQLALTATHQPLTLEHVPHCRADCGGPPRRPATRPSPTL